MNPVQSAKPEQCDNANFTELERAKVVVPGSDQSLSDMEIVVLNKNVVEDKSEETSNAVGSADKHKNELQDSYTTIEDNERSKELELPEEVHDGVVIIEGKVHFNDISETPHVNRKINVAACKDESMCPALDLSDSPSLQNTEGDVNMIEEAERELDTGVEPMVYSVCQNELEGTSQKCSVEKDKEKSCGFDVLETVSYAVLVRKVVEEASVDALLLSADEASGKQRAKACCTDQPVDPRIGQIGASGLWMEGGCWIYII
jgi:hypothetical protein